PLTCPLRLSTHFLLSSPASAPSHLYTLSLHDALPIFPAPSCLAGPAETTPIPASASGCKAWKIAGPAFATKARSTRRMSAAAWRSEEHTSELQSRFDLVCRLLLEKKNRNDIDKHGLVD